MNKEKMFSFDIKKKVFLGNRQGSILAYSLIILSMMLAIATSLSIATILAKKSASGTEFSVQSLQTADSGVQLALKEINNNLDKPIDNPSFFGGACTQPGGVATIPAQTISNAGTYELSFYGTGGTTKLNCNDLIGDIEAIKSVGVYRDTVRVIDVAVAAPPCGGIPLKAGVPTLTDARPGESIDYPVVEIGDQCWMAENLRATRDINGNPLRLWNANGLNNSADYWCCTIGDNSCRASHVCDAPRGPLYNWPTAMGVPTMTNYLTNFDYTALSYPAGGTTGMKIRGICPLGWHIPSSNGLGDDMEKLSALVAAMTNVGGNLKVTGIPPWNTPNAGATNSTKFSAVPGGHWDAGFTDGTTMTDFWTSLQNDNDEAHTWQLNYISTSFAKVKTFKEAGSSVRCIKD